MVAYTNYGCEDSTYGQVKVFGTPKANFSINNPAQCENNNSFVFTDLTLSAKPHSVFFDFGDGNNGLTNPSVHSYSSKGTYRVRLTSTVSPGCFDTISKVVSLLPKPHLAFSTNDSIQCQKDNDFIFTNNSVNPPGSISYIWNFNDNSADTAFSTQHHYDLSGVFFVQLIGNSSSNCRDTFIKSVYVSPSPLAGFTINDSQQCLKGNHFTFTSTTIIDFGPINNSWWMGDGNAQSSLYGFNSYTLPGNYTVKLRSDALNNCSDSTEKSITVFAMPDASFQLVFSNPETARFVPGTNTNVAYDWDFGDGSTSTDVSPLHTFQSKGPFPIRLITTDHNNCADTGTFELKIDNPIFNSNSSQNNFLIFPNITYGKVTVKFDLPENSSFDFGIYDLLGKRIYSNTFDKNPKGINVLEIDFNELGLAKGVYYFILETGGGRIVERVVFH
jgi:PKD repeat protein